MRITYIYESRTLDVLKLEAVLEDGRVLVVGYSDQPHPRESLESGVRSVALRRAAAFNALYRKASQLDSEVVEK